MQHQIQRLTALLSFTILLLAQPVWAENKVIGSKQCSDSNCHQSTYDQMLYHPHESFFNEKYEEDGQKIADKMQVKDHFEDKACIKCHGTLVESNYSKIPEEEKGLFGVVCETCHKPAEDWVEIHDKKGKVAEAVDKGMRDTRNLYAWATDCFACHRGAKEKYFKAGHRLGDKFDLIKYSQGDFKHWVWSKEDKAAGNLQATLQQKLIKIWITGEILQVQTSVERISEASAPGEFTSKNHALFKKALKNLDKASKLIPLTSLNELIGQAEGITANPKSAKKSLASIKQFSKNSIIELQQKPIGPGKFGSFPIPAESSYKRIKK